MWQGTPVEGSPWTVEQARVMREERPTWTHYHVRSITLEASSRERWLIPDTFVVQCPIIAWTKDKARVLVITPAGFKHWMAAR